MGVDVNIQPSTYAIIGGGIWGTANTCAGAPEILAQTTRVQQRIYSLGDAPSFAFAR